MAAFFFSTLRELHDAGDSRGSATALVTAEDGEKRITYSELYMLCSKLGLHLRKFLGDGDVVSIVLPRRTSLAQVVGTLGTMAYNLVAAPLNPSYKVEELEFFLSDAEARVVLVEAANESGKSAWLAATTLKIPTCAMALDWHATQGPTLTLSECMVASGERDRDGETKLVPTPDDIALVLHTSGTTSRPKLVPLTHRNMCASISAVVRHYGIEAKDNTLIVQPLFHIGGLVTPLLSTLSVGGQVAIASMFDDSRHWQFVFEHGVTWFTAVPTIHKVLLANAERDFNRDAFGGEDPPRLRFIRSGSAALPPDFLAKIEKSFGAPLIESYGMTEAAQLICANPLPADGPRYAGSVGICAGPDGRVFDAETGRPAAFEEDGSTTGEMCIAGPSVMLGYARNPEANAGSFIKDDEGRAWFRTGDLVARTPEGYYSIVGRIKEIINRAGEKIAPAKLDKILAYENRKDSVVSFGVPDPDYGQGVAAAMVFDPDKFEDDQAPTDAETRRRAELLIKTALEKLASHEVPTTIYALNKDDVPKTATGKTKRLKCGELCVESFEPVVKNGVWRECVAPAAIESLEGPASSSSEVRTTTMIEDGRVKDSNDCTLSLDEAKSKARTAIAEALTAVGVPLAVADDSPLMQSGLTSMMVFGFVRALSATLELETTLPHMLVFDAPTPAALSSELAERLTRPDAATKDGGAVLPSTVPSVEAPKKETTVSAASWRLPGVAADGVADPDAVRAVLDDCAGVRMPVPASRWSPEAFGIALGSFATESVVSRCQFGGFVDGLDSFDNSQFGISQAEASLMDPQQRMLMEHGYAALVANEGPLATQKTSYEVGVFVGVSFHDWALSTLWNGDPSMRKSAFASSGSFTSVASGRLSFALGLRGPCVTINTACSSGLVALGDAHRAVVNDDAVDGALAAATNVILEPTISINFAVKGITSPRGRCHTFDSSADGYLRSEACACFRLDSISSSWTRTAAAVTKSVVVRHDGKSASLTAPNGSAQLAMLLKAKITPAVDDRSFVEAHGTATPLGDPIEVGALTRLAAISPSNKPHRFAISGAKCSYGHCEAAAGSVGLLALLLAARSEHVAPNGALCKINPAVRDALLSTAHTINLGCTETTPVPSTVGGVSSLGASGTIAHAVLSSSRDASAAGVLHAKWPIYSTRCKFPWKPYQPASSPVPLSSQREEMTSVAETVRAVAKPFLDGKVDDKVALFDAGLDSLVAIELVAELQAKFEPLELPQTLLNDYPSIADIADFVSSKLDGSQLNKDTLDDEFVNLEGDDGPTVVVKKMMPGTPVAPLVGSEQIFFIHGVDGDPLGMLFHQVAAEIRFPSSTVRCIEMPKAQCSTLEELAAYYVSRVKERQPTGAYRIFGHSFGALIAHQVALQLERQGESVAALILGDFEVTYPPSRSRTNENNGKGRFGLEEWEGGEIESIKLACRRFGSTNANNDGASFDPDEFRERVLDGAKSPSERRMRAMFHYMPAYMQRREWDRLLDLWERNMEYLHTVTVPKFGPKRRQTWEPDGVVKGPTLHLRALNSHEFAAAVEINRKYCADYRVQALKGLHYTFLQKPNSTGVAQAVDDFISSKHVSAESVVETISPSKPTAIRNKKPSPAHDALTASTFPEVVAAHAKRRGSAPCLVSWDRKGGVVETVSYAELDARAQATAQRLFALDVVVKGEALAILSHASVAAHIVVLAAMIAGLPAVMLNPRLAGDVLASLCASTRRCAAVATGVALREIAAGFAPGVASTTLVMLGSTDNVPPDLHEDESPLPTTSAPPTQRAAMVHQCGGTVDPEKPCIVMFTSGTTGSPKPIERTHRQILFAVDRMRTFEVSEGLCDSNSGTLSFLPLYHMMGLTHNFVLNIRLGARVLIHGGAPYMPLTLGLLLEAAPVLKPTAIESIAVVAEQLSEMLEIGGDMTRDIAKRLGTVSHVKVGGSPLPKRVVRTLEAHGLRVLSHFGQTELCGYVLAAITPRDDEQKLPLSPAEELDFYRIASSDVYGNEEDPNYPIDERRIEAALSFEEANMRVVDRSMRIELRGDSGGNAGYKKAGELVITRGLWSTTDASAYRTGDIFVQSSSGGLTFRARLDGMLVLGSGEMIDPATVETYLMRALARYVKRCCLVGNGRPRPALLVELRDSARDPNNAVRPLQSVLDALSTAISKVKGSVDTATAILPTHVIILPKNEKIPTTLKGEVDASASQTHFANLLGSADRGSLIPNSLQSFHVDHHLDEKE